MYSSPRLNILTFWHVCFKCLYSQNNTKSTQNLQKTFLLCCLNLSPIQSIMPVPVWSKNLLFKPTSNKQTSAQGITATLRKDYKKGIFVVTYNISVWLSFIFKSPFASAALPHPVVPASQQLGGPDANWGPNLRCLIISNVSLGENMQNPINCCVVYRLRWYSEHTRWRKVFC